MEQHGEAQSMMLKRTPPKRTFKAFIGHAPIVTIINTILLLKRALTRVRVQEFRERERIGKRKRDPIRYYPLRDSFVDKLAADLKIKQSDDKAINDHEWRKLIG